jgi:hypothetical protein
VPGLSHEFLARYLISIILSLPFVLAYKRVRSMENALARFAGRPLLSLLTLFFGVIGIRLLLLAKLRVPTPYFHDEFSYLLMGDTFAHGRLANPSIPVWISFETFHVNWQPTYSSMYPPMQGLVLAIGELLGHPWIGVLLSNAAMCVAVLWMLRGWMPARWAFFGGALIAVQLCFATYWMNSYWGGSASAIGGSLVLGSLARLLKRTKIRYALLLALGMAILANSRPFEGAIFCLPTAIYLFLWLLGKVGSGPALAVRWKKIFLPIFACGVLTLCFMGYYNWRLTGNPLLMPHVLNTRTSDTGKTFLWQKPDPPREYRNAQFEDFYNGWEREYYQRSWPDIKRITLEKIHIFGVMFFWNAELLLLPFFPFLFRDRRIRLLLITFLLSAFGLFIVVWGQAHYAGPLICVLAALTVQTTRHLNTVKWKGIPLGSMAARIIVVFLFTHIGAEVLASHCDHFEYHCVGMPAREAVEKELQSLPGKHLVLVRYTDNHNPHEEWVYNGADIDGTKVLWARELDAEQNAKLLSYFKERKGWLVEADDDEPEPAPFVTH